MKELTIRGIIIGVLGSIIVTMSSIFIALKLSALPWPIMFVAITSFAILKALGNTNLREINVTHTIMSSGAMVAGGIAFTLPAIWILNPSADIELYKIIGVGLIGVLLSIVFTYFIRKLFIEKQELSFPMGQAAASMLETGDKGDKKGLIILFSAIVSGIFTLIRDYFKLIPQTILSKTYMKSGALIGLWYSPMLIAIGYIIGPIFIGVWFLGAIIGDVFIMILGTNYMGLDVAKAASIKSSLGIGLMFGTGLGIVLKGVIPALKNLKGKLSFKLNDRKNYFLLILFPILIAIILIFNLNLIQGIILILGIYIAILMSCQCVGQSGINPMEIFAVIIVVSMSLIWSFDNNQYLYMVGIIAVSCGLVGDIMNDFKVGSVFGTKPSNQLIGELIGGIIGAIVSAVVLYVVIKAYGGASFQNGEFTVAQAHLVSNMIAGISHKLVFIIGLASGMIMYLLKLPVMTLGLGVYLPFYLSFTAFIGGAIRFIVDKFFPKVEEKQIGSLLSSGILAGEGVLGVIIAIITAVKIIY